MQRSTHIKKLRTYDAVPTVEALPRKRAEIAKRRPVGFEFGAGRVVGTRLMVRLEGEDELGRQRSCGEERYLQCRLCEWEWYGQAQKRAPGCQT